MILGSHNSWSYLKPRKWWMRLFNLASKCQDVGIASQYIHYNVRCFDLRIRFTEKDYLQVAHGLAVYDTTLQELLDDLQFIDFLGDCSIRIIHEVRNKSQYTSYSVREFVKFCDYIKSAYPHIRFWCGKNLYNWETDYAFSYQPSCEERYSSVCSPKLLDDWYPRLYAYLHNRKIIKKGTDKDILLIDFVNYS